jgi:dTDP-4-dehydrorhamnose reductase
VYGWAPQAEGPGWIEQILSDLESGCAGPFDYLRHATPILATDFASILIKAWEMDLDGVYHIAGAERVNPNQFVERLADEFMMPGPMPVNGNCLTERPRGFGCGECSLHTNKIRNAVKCAMPTVADGLRRLREQTLSGYCDRLAAEGSPVQGKVA